MSLQELIERFSLKNSVEGLHAEPNCNNCVFFSECGYLKMDMCEDYAIKN